MIPHEERAPSRDTTPETTRREFLKESAVGAASLGALSLAQSAYAAGTEELRIGMIGAGGRCSGAAAQALAVGPYVKLVAACDIFEDRLEQGLAALRAEAPDQVRVDAEHRFVGFDGYRHVIESADVVLIACASKFHPMYAEAAVRAGKHVFVEKPHGIDPAGVRRMRAACDLAREKGLSIVSGLQSRFDPGWQETVARIHDGAIGDVVAVQSMFLRGPYAVVPRRPGLGETEYQFRNWYHFRWLSGDDVTQSLVHNVDRISWIMQEEMPAWCFGLGGRSSSFGEEYGDMFDHHTAVYEYASGARLYALCRTQNGCYNNATDVIMGTKGRCHLGRYAIEGETNWRYEGPGGNPYDLEQKALIDSVRAGEPVNCGDYMANSTLVAVMGQLACYSGEPVAWDDVRASELCLGPRPEDSTFDTEPPSVLDDTGNYPLPKPGITRFL